MNVVYKKNKFEIINHQSIRTIRIMFINTIIKFDHTHFSLRKELFYELTQ